MARVHVDLKLEVVWYSHLGHLLHSLLAGSHYPAVTQQLHIEKIKLAMNCTEYMAPLALYKYIITTFNSTDKMKLKDHYSFFKSSESKLWYERLQTESSREDGHDGCNTIQAILPNREEGQL